MTTPNPFAAALKLLEDAGMPFVLAMEFESGSTMVCASKTSASLRRDVNEQMDARAVDREADRPSDVVEQLQEIGDWLRSEGHDNTAVLVERARENVEYTYDVSE